MWMWVGVSLLVVCQDVRRRRLYRGCRAHPYLVYLYGVPDPKVVLFGKFSNDCVQRHYWAISFTKNVGNIALLRSLCSIYSSILRQNIISCCTPREFTIPSKHKNTCPQDHAAKVRIEDIGFQVYTGRSKFLASLKGTISLFLHLLTIAWIDISYQLLRKIGSLLGSFPSLCVTFARSSYSIVRIVHDYSSLSKECYNCTGMTV